MTGGEIAAGAAAGKIAAAAAKGIGQEQKAVNRELLEAARTTPGFEVAAATYGRRQAVKQQVLLNLYRPLAKIMGVSLDYFASDFAVDLADKTQDVPDENLQTPKASVAGPAMQGLMYALDEPELKDLYLELLARASDSRVATKVHPSFASVIRELSEAEARYLPQFIVGSQNRAIVQIKMIVEPGARSVVRKTHVLNLRDALGRPDTDPQLPTYVDNWARLGLIEVHYDGTLKDELYVDIEERSDVVLLMSTINASPPPEGTTAVKGEAARGYLVPTAFGQQFASVVGMTKFVPQTASPAG